MSKQKKLYSKHSSRLQTWGCSRSGYYFVTMTVRGRERWFGEIRNGVMHKTPLAEFAEKSWKKTLELRPSLNIWLGEFVVMPDHFQAVLFIGENEHNASLHSSEFPQTGEQVLRTLIQQKNGLHPYSNNLASIIRGFKASVTTEARRRGIPFNWDSRYHDSIARNAGDLNFFRSYIRKNVERWKM